MKAIFVLIVVLVLGVVLIHTGYFPRYTMECSTPGQFVYAQDGHEGDLVRFCGMLEYGEGLQNGGGTQNGPANGGFHEIP